MMRVPSSLSPEEQWRLAQRAAEGDAAARDALIDSHREGLAAFAREVVGAERAADAAAAGLAELRRLYDDPERGFDPNRGFLFGLWCTGIAKAAFEGEPRSPTESGEVAPSDDPAKDAREGRLAPLAALYRGHAEGALDALLWLLAARDHGHPAGPWLDDLYEMSELRADDDGLATAAAHWALAMRYLEGADGLSVDLDRARTHIAEALERHGDFEALRAEVPPRWHPETVAPRLDGAALDALRASSAAKP